MRFAPDTRPDFVIQAPQNVDPLSLVQIVRLTVRKGHREMITAQSHGFMGFGGIRTEQDKESVSFQASKYNASSIKITPTEGLAPGEYAIRKVAREVFCFGVNN